MLNRLLSCCLLAALTAFTAGCACTHPGMAPMAGGCGDCTAASCGDCGPCGGGCYPGPILRGLGSLFSCHGGCGEVYYDEWCSDPPDCCDPCNSCGDYTGYGCCSPWNPLAGLSSLWGYRYAGGCGSGCCGSYEGGMMMSGMEMMPEMQVMPGTEMVPADGEEGIIPAKPEPMEDSQAVRRSNRPRFTTTSGRSTLRR